jgi:hypothetical protein
MSDRPHVQRAGGSAPGPPKVHHEGTKARRTRRRGMPDDKTKFTHGLGWCDSLLCEAGEDRGWGVPPKAAARPGKEIERSTPCQAGTAGHLHSGRSRVGAPCFRATIAKKGGVPGSSPKTGPTLHPVIRFERWSPCPAGTAKMESRGDAKARRRPGLLARLDGMGMERNRTTFLRPPKRASRRRVDPMPSGEHRSKRGWGPARVALEGSTRETCGTTLCVLPRLKTAAIPARSVRRRSSGLPTDTRCQKPHAPPNRLLTGTKERVRTK